MEGGSRKEGSLENNYDKAAAWLSWEESPRGELGRQDSVAQGPAWNYYDSQ